MFHNIDSCCETILKNEDFMTLPIAIEKMAICICKLETCLAGP
jgi:hypothetical protein